METLPAHFLSSLVLSGRSLVVPFLALGTCLGSAATARKLVGIALDVAIWGITVYLFARHWQFGLERPKPLWDTLIASSIFCPPQMVVYQTFSVGNDLSLAWLTALQVF